MPVDYLRTELPGVFDSLMLIQQQLEKHYRDMQVRSKFNGKIEKEMNGKTGR